MKTVYWCGFGNLGFPMALRLAEQFRVIPLFNPSHTNNGAMEFQKKLGLFDSQIDFSENNQDILITCLPRSSDVSKLLSRLHFLPRWIVDVTTSSSDDTIALAQQMKKRGSQVLDCPVSGSVEQARSGQLTCFVGAEESKSEPWYQVISQLSSRLFFFGNVGNGSKAKLVNQFIHLSNMSVIKWALILARKNNLSVKDLVDSLLVSSGSSRMLERFGKQIIAEEFSPAFTLELALKDLTIVEKFFEDSKVKCSLLENILSDYQEGVDRGFQRLNFSAICKETRVPGSEKNSLS
jgi:3-hydroxyisobutyrate dehydrogenase